MPPHSAFDLYPNKIQRTAYVPCVLGYENHDEAHLQSQKQECVVTLGGVNDIGAGKLGGCPYKYFFVASDIVATRLIHIV